MIEWRNVKSTILYKYFNLINDTFNPVFNITLPKYIDPTTAPFTSIVSSTFPVDNSYYIPIFNNYLTGNTKNVILLIEVLNK